MSKAIRQDQASCTARSADGPSGAFDTTRNLSPHGIWEPWNSDLWLWDQQHVINVNKRFKKTLRQPWSFKLLFSWTFGADHKFWRKGLSDYQHPSTIARIRNDVACIGPSSSLQACPVWGQDKWGAPSVPTFKFGNSKIIKDPQWWDWWNMVEPCWAHAISTGSSLFFWGLQSRQDQL